MNAGDFRRLALSLQGAEEGWSGRGNPHRESGESDVGALCQFVGSRTMAMADKVEIRWPGRQVQVLTVTEAGTR